MKKKRGQLQSIQFKLILQTCISALRKRAMLLPHVSMRNIRVHNILIIDVFVISETLLYIFLYVGTLYWRTF